MYKIKQKFTIECEYDMEMTKEEFKSFGFNDNRVLRGRLNENLKQIKKDLTPTLSYQDANNFKFTTMKTSLEINSGFVTGIISEELKEDE